MTTDLTQARTHAAGHRVGRGPEREVIARTIEGLADEVEEARESVSILNDVLLVLRNEQAYVSGSAVEMVRGLIAEVGRLRAQVAQAGWTLVPVEPTPEMLSAGYEGAANYSGQNEELGCWRAMLAASPAAQQAPQPLGDAATRPGLSAAGELTPIETIRYWADAYADPDSGDHFLGHGMIVHLLREYLAVRLAQAPEQAQEAAPASAHRPSVEWYRAKIADTEELDGSLPCGALAAPAQQAEPPSQAQAAERESIANELLLIASVLQGYPASMARGDALRAVTAVQLAVARICNASQAQAGDEQQRAIHEAERNAASERYFNARPWVLDDTHNLRLFDAGFDAGAALASRPAKAETPTQAAEPIDTSFAATWTDAEKAGYIAHSLKWPACGYVHGPDRIQSLRVAYQIANELEASLAPPTEAPDAPPGEVVVTWDEHRTRIVGVTRQDEEGRILSVIAMAPKAEAPDARDAARLDFLDHEANELRTVATAEDDFDWVVVSLHMSEPRERELGRGKSARSAIDAALAAQPGEQQAPGNSKT